MGSRYGGLKQLDGIGPNGETIMDYSLFDALKAGFQRVVFVIRPDMQQAFMELAAERYAAKLEMEAVFQRLNDLPTGFSVPANRTKPWGTAHALLTARQKIDTPFAVINADDYYGPEAFRILAGFLSETPEKPLPQFALVGYPLKNTLSPNGSVSRAVCRTDPHGRILRLIEHKEIFKKEGRIVSIEAGGKERILPPDTYVSMNLMGFTPVVFGFLQTYLSEFLKRRGEDSAAEYLLPQTLNQIITAAKAEVYLLKTSARWFGVTYKKDKRSAVKKIRRLIALGRYPQKLWD